MAALIHMTAEDVQPHVANLTLADSTAWALKSDHGAPKAIRIANMVFLQGAITRVSSEWNGQGTAFLQLTLPNGFRPRDGHLRVLEKGPWKFFIAADGRVSVASQWSAQAVPVGAFIEFDGLNFCIE